MNVGPRTFKAPRESTCAGCWQPIFVGAPVRKNLARGQRQPWWHASCVAMVQKAGIK